jgi:hypothetical protein
MFHSARETTARNFREYMRRSNELHATYLAEPGVPEQYERFTDWQMRYLLSFFEDLYEREGYAEAIDFTMSDLAGVSVSYRDRDIERAAPVFTRMLPLKPLQTLTAAAKLNLRVLEMNLGNFGRLQVDGELPAEIDELAYCAAFRQTSTPDDCDELVRLAISLGSTLKRLIRMPLLGAMLRTMHMPAHASGFGALHDFLETGYTTFKGIPDVDHFLEEIDTRMSEVFEHIFAQEA